MNTKWDCINYGGHWKQENLNFDNIPSAMFSQFVMVTQEGWVSIMQSSTDSTDVNLSPQLDYKKHFQVFYILFILFSTTFIVNLFTEVIMATYEKQTQIIDKDFDLILF